MKSKLHKTTGQSNFRSQVLVVGIATALTFPLVTTVQAQESITVNAYSGPWETAMKKCFFDPFSKESGIEVIIDSGTASVTYARLRQQKGAPRLDVAWLDAGYSEQAWDEGLIQEILPEAAPNIKNLSKKANYQTKDGKTFAVGTGYFSYGLAYNPSEVNPPPTSWFDLWDEAYAGRVYAPSPAQSLFTPLLMHLNEALGSSNKDFTPIINKFKELKVSSYYEASGVMNATIQSGEVVMGVYYPNTVALLAEQNVPIKIAIPKEGAIASDIRMHLVADTPKKEAAQKLINYVAQSAPLECMAEEIFLGPPLDNPNISEKAQQAMPWGIGGSVADLRQFDWHEVNAQRQPLRNLWNRRVISQ